jgi:CheY-like chemotaxis protein
MVIGMTAAMSGKEMNRENARRWILIVDDDSSVRTMLARVLIDEGYGVLTAANGGDAVDLAETTLLDLILLDLNMPVMDGWETLKKLAPRPPIIIITARPNQQSAARAAGVAAVLEKPLDFPLLIETVSRTLAKAVNSRDSA